MEFTPFLMDNGYCDPSLDALDNGAGLQFSWDNLLFPLVCCFLDCLMGRKGRYGRGGMEGEGKCCPHCYSEQRDTGQGLRKSQVLIWLLRTDAQIESPRVCPSGS